MYKVNFIFVLIFLCGQIQAQTTATDPCANPETAAFDFQIGVWVLSDGKQVHEISKTLGGCAIEEKWKTEGKITARAIKSFDNGNHDKNGEKRWFYTWAGRGYHQLWQGRKEDGVWRFYRDWWFNGGPILSRTYWTRLSANSLERIIEQSLDGGKTWRLHLKDAFTKKQ